jgi:succinylglutamate desuccinylase
MASSARSKMRSVAIVGGTHGNERGGVHLARFFEDQAPVDRWRTLKVRGVIANEQAVQMNTRYVDEDLNRCFTHAKLNEVRDTYEAKRAGELNQLLGPKGNAKADFIFDLHNSTSNTGMLLCFHHSDALAREVAAHLNRLNSDVRLAHWPKGDQPFLPTIGKSGMTVELGPVAHGTVHSPSVERVLNLLYDGLDYLDRLNHGSAAQEARVDHTVCIGERVASIDFPRDPLTNDAAAFLHASVQGLPELQEGSYLKTGQPLFVTVDGSVAERYDPAKYGLPSAVVDEKMYPVFVNEAAYFEKGTALFLYHRVDDVKVSVLPVESTAKRHEADAV